MFGSSEAWAIRGKSTKCLAQFVAFGWDINAAVDVFGHTPLHLIAAVGTPHMVDILIGSNNCNLEVRKLAQSTGELLAKLGTHRLQITLESLPLPLPLCINKKVSPENLFGNICVLIVWHHPIPTAADVGLMFLAVLKYDTKPGFLLIFVSRTQKALNGTSCHLFDSMYLDYLLNVHPCLIQVPLFIHVWGVSVFFEISSLVQHTCTERVKVLGLTNGAHTGHNSLLYHTHKQFLWHVDDVASHHEKV